jgi:hypothetical protein
LQDRLGNAAQNFPLTIFSQKPGQIHVSLRHRCVRKVQR